MRLLMSVLLVGATAASAGAQGSSVTIDPGMTRDQVVAKLGEPLSTRSYDNHTYLLYKNGCEKTCGMNDLVVLDSGKVVDAVFRAPGRKYSGTSSSPRMISESEAKRGSNSGGTLTMPAGEPKGEKPKSAPKAPTKAVSAPKTTTAPAAKAPPTSVPAKKVEVPPPNKAAAPPAPKTNAAPAKKTEPTVPAKKDTTKKKPPTSHEI